MLLKFMEKLVFAICEYFCCFAVRDEDNRIQRRFKIAIGEDHRYMLIYSQVVKMQANDARLHHWLDDHLAKIIFF